MPIEVRDFNMEETEVARHNRILQQLEKNPALLLEAAEVAKDAASSLGLLLKDKETPDAFNPVPVTLLPSLVPRHAVHEVLQLQKDFNLLMHQVAHDREFLTSTLAGVASVDPFIKNLLDIYDQIDINSQWELGFIRSDYLLHCDNKNLSFGEALDVATYKQVEVNMICIAFAGLSSKMHSVHNHVLNFFDCDFVERPEAGDVLPLYGNAVSLAQSVYAKNHPPTAGRLQIVLTVIHAGERNTMDQRMIEFESGVFCLRRTFDQIAQGASVESGRLVLEGKEVAVVYYRTGYAPPHYETPEHWKTRLLMERSFAIKCPSVAHQLSGFKKVQQELSKAEVLEKFISEESVRKRMLDTCVGQWDLSSSADDIFKKALEFPEQFVLKPNREGGGNNFYDADLIAKLNEVRGTSQAREFILMSRIEPPLQDNYLIRAQMPPELVKTISEIGVFGVIIAKNEHVLFNLSAQDILVRSKASTVNEGGVATGYACLGSACIVDI